SRFSVRGKSKVENELGFALMAVNLRKYTAMSNKDDYKPVANRSKKRTESKFSLIQSVFTYRRRVLSQPQNGILIVLLAFWLDFQNFRRQIHAHFLEYLFLFGGWCRCPIKISIICGEMTNVKPLDFTTY